MMRPEADAAIQIAMEVHRITEEKIAEAYRMAEHSRSSTEQLDALRRALRSQTWTVRALMALVHELALQVPEDRPDEGGTARRNLH